LSGGGVEEQDQQHDDDKGDDTRPFGEAVTLDSRFAT
jgi:hypothetical protein